MLVAILLMTAAVFMIGDNRRLWDSKITYTAAYDDVSGLKPGSVVRMSGIDIGSVADVRHADDPKDGRVYVKLSVAREEAGRIRRGTVARIEGKGFLGDKMVQLAWDEDVAKAMRADVNRKGAPEDILPPSEAMTTAPTADPIGDAQRAAQEAKVAMQNLQKATEGIADERFKQDLHGTVKALREILEGVSQGEGAAHRLIYDKNEAQRIDNILANMEVTSRNLAQVTADAKDVSSRAKSGPGLVHSLVYDGELAQGTTGTVVELHKSLQAIRTGNGVAHAIVYGDDNTQHVMGNINVMSDDLREIVANVKAGRGTVGALLVDPTVYEDIKSLVGNVERNQVLRALVRYSIKQNEEKPAHVEVKDVPQPTVTPVQQKSGAGASR